MSAVRLAISLIDKCSRKNIRRILAYMTMVITSFTSAYKISRILVLPSQNSTRTTVLRWSYLMRVSNLNTYAFLGYKLHSAGFAVNML